MRSVWEMVIVLLARSRTSCWPRYLVLITGPQQMNLMNLDISDTNHLYRWVEFEMARPSSTWTGMKRNRGHLDEGRGIEECGGVVHHPIKTA